MEFIELTCILQKTSLLNTIGDNAPIILSRACLAVQNIESIREDPAQMDDDPCNTLITMKSGDSFLIPESLESIKDKLGTFVHQFYSY